MQTRAAVLYKSGLERPYTDSLPLKIETLTLSPPGPGEVAVEIKATGLCHSDLSTINGNRPRPTPMVLGHEAVGVVMQVGDYVNNFSKGDHVSVIFVPTCGSCVPCNEGRPALCEPGAAANGAGTLLSGEKRLKGEHGSVYHHLGVSGFAEIAVVSERSLVKIPKDITFEKAALFGCAVLTGVGAVVNSAQVKPGTSVAIVGLGGVGLNALLGAKLCGASRIAGIDIKQSKLDSAQEMGAGETYLANEEGLAEKIRSDSGGFDYVIELAGSVEAMQLAYEITKRGGTTVSAGLSHPEKKFAIQHVNLVGEEKTIKGSYLGSCIPRRDIPRFIELFHQGLLPVDKTLSGTVSLDEINTGFENLATGEVLRQVMVN